MTGADVRAVRQASMMTAGLCDVALIDTGRAPGATGTGLGSFVDQFRAGMERLERTLTANRSSLDRVLRAEIHIAEGGPETYNALQNAFLEGFSALPRPARCVSAVPRLPHGAQVEIGCIAVVGSGRANNPLSAVVAPDGPAPCAPFPHARIYRTGIWVTAQVGSDPETRSLSPVGGGSESQLRYAIGNLSVILSESGATLSDVVHARIQYVDEGERRLLAEMATGDLWPASVVELVHVPFIPTAQDGVTVKVDAVARLSNA